MLGTTCSYRALAAMVMSFVVLAIPATALADRDRHDYRAGYDRGDRYRADDHRFRDRGRNDRTDWRIDVRIGDRFVPPPPPRVELRETRVWIEPVYRTVVERVWIEPVYRTSFERVWIEPEYREEIERVWVPDCYEYRDVVCYEYGRRVVRRERVLVRPGYWEMRPRRVLVCEGRWETIERRELVCEGHWKTIECQQLVSPGRWETRLEHIAVHERPAYERGGFEVHARFAR